MKVFVNALTRFAFSKRRRRSNARALVALRRGAKNAAFYLVRTSVSRCVNLLRKFLWNMKLLTKAFSFDNQTRKAICGELASHFSSCASFCKRKVANGFVQSNGLSTFGLQSGRPEIQAVHVLFDFSSSSFCRTPCQRTGWQRRNSYCRDALARGGGRHRSYRFKQTPFSPCSIRLFCNFQFSLFLKNA